MKAICLLPFVSLVLSGCLPQLQPDQIVVNGEASLEFEPEFFSLNGAIRARRGTQAEALADIASKLASVREIMPNLDGLTNLTIDASVARLIPIQDSDCIESRRYNGEEQCPVEAYFGSVDLGIKGAPANLSGQALSLLSELGVESVSFSGYALLDNETAKRDALGAAVLDARAKAEKIAAAANSSVVSPIRIQYGEGFPDAGYGGVMADAAAPDMIVVTGSREVRPEVDLDLDPQPIRISAKIVAAFEIE